MSRVATSGTQVDRPPVGSRLVGRSGESAMRRAAEADVAQLAERVLGKDEVTSSILVIGSNLPLTLANGRVSYGWQARRRLSTVARRAEVDCPS